MKVIGVGLPRTGTLTQKVALEMLGVGPCYHMVNVLQNLDLVQQWQDALEGRPDWDTIFKGCQSTVDWPGGFFWRELMEHYPDAKVLLSVRDPEKWEHSMRDTVWACYYGDSLIYHLSMATYKVDDQWKHFIDTMTQLLWEGPGTIKGHETKQGMMDAMHRFNDEVKSTVSSDRLLVWDVTEGWEPLCEFLEIECPSEPMPHVNDSSTFADRIVEMAQGKIGAWYEQKKADAPAPAAAAAH
jgi:Sulfotransferase domain